jgi:transposase InsO family protein
LSGPIPRRVEAATKAGLLDLLEEALDSGWTVRRACGALELPERRAHRWIGRRSRGQLLDKAPGGSPAHGLLPGEEREILALFDEWGETDRSHRKLAHRGSYLRRVWVSPSSVRRVLFLADKHFRPRPRPGKSVKKPFPDWVEYKPNCIWIYDTTHFPAAGMAVLIIEDLVSRKWLTEIVSSEETSTQVELAFTDALEAEGLLEAVDARHGDDGRVDISVDDESRPVLLAVSDNGPQMTSGSTREFLALCAIAQHFGRPGTPTDQAWIESLFGHVKADWPHLDKITDPEVLRAELAEVRRQYNTVRLHAGIGYVTPEDEHEGRGPKIRAARKRGLKLARWSRVAYHRIQQLKANRRSPTDVD